MANAMETLLAELLEETTRQLLARIKAGEASPADFKNARELLKDNNITPWKALTNCTKCSTCRKRSTNASACVWRV